jgi:serine/threonine protein kinase
MKPNTSSDDGSTVETRPQCEQKQQPQESPAERSPSSVPVEAYEYVEKEVEKLLSVSRILKKDADESIEDLPVIFHRDEIMTCTLLGNGAFSEVHQIWGFQPSAVHPDPVQQDARELMSQSAIDLKGCRYVIKHLRHDILPNKTRFVHAASDLVMEALFLSKIDHPNIIKLRGCSQGIGSYSDGSHDGFFLVLDRLDEMLSHRILKWAHDPVCRRNVYSKQLNDYAEKIDIACQISRALDHLHDRDIIFRDLKPDNIGFKGDMIQIFDFGLCRELPEECPVEDKKFRMSGVGTRRYMAPEIFLGQNYNLKADVYSFTMVFHAMLSLQRPFDQYNAALHKLLVCQEGIRPTITADWPSEIQQLCRTGWAQDPNQRPTIKEVRQTLERLKQEAETEIVPGLNFIEASLNLFDKCAEHLCDDTHRFNKHAGNVLRLLENHMVTASIPQRDRFTTELPHLQHLRSQYL